MENEIKDHVVKAYHTAKNPGLNFWHKAGEIAIEILIIVFAVTLSIWVHDRSEYNHEQKDVKAFLTGLKKDLSSDIVQLQEDKDAYIGAGMAFKYVSKQSPDFKLNTDSIKKYQDYLFNGTEFIPNNGRYEGFKSSGKLGNVEDNELQNDITSFYQGIVPTISASASSYSQRKQFLFEYLYKNIRRDANGHINLISVLSTDEAHIISLTLSSTEEITARYDRAIKKSKEIIRKINVDYDLK